MEYSGFFNSVNGDRKYKAEDFANYFNSFVTNGIFPKPATNCQVTADGMHMNITIKAGKAWINGYCYYLDEDLTLNINVADGVLNRIDRIVLRMDTAERSINATVKKGIYASLPVAPTLERDADGYEIALADVYVGAGITSIRQADITDLRLDTTLCGVVNSIIQADTTAIFDQYQDWFNGQKTGYEKSMQNEFNNWFSNIRDLLSTDQAGSLQNELGTYVTTNNGNDYSVTIPKIAALSENIPVCVKFNAASTGDTTLNINSLGAKSIVDYFGNIVTNIRANLIANLRYESLSDSFILQGKGGGGTAIADDIVSGKTATTNQGLIVGTLTLVGTAEVGDVINGKTFYNTNAKTIQTGTGSNAKKWANGVKNVDTTSSPSNVTVNGLSFLPKYILIWFGSFTDNSTTPFIMMAYNADEAQSKTISVGIDHNGGYNTYSYTTQEGVSTSNNSFTFVNRAYDIGTITYNWIAFE